MRNRGFVQLLFATLLATGCRSTDSAAELVVPEVVWVRWKEGSDRSVAVCKIANRTERDVDFFGFAPRRPVVVLWHQDEQGWHARGGGEDDCTPLYTLTSGSELLVEVPLAHAPGRQKISMSFVEFLGDRWVRSEVETRPFPGR